jgi:mitochondrial fission protein ELM1
VDGAISDAEAFFVFSRGFLPDSFAGVTRPLTIWILGDGKPGHENQSLGLAEAMGRRVECEIHRIAAHPWRDALSTAWNLPPPDLIVAAGHATHGMLAWLKRTFRARSVVLMRPSLPACFFDLVIAPEHDFKKPPTPGGRVLATKGAINRVVPADAGGKQDALVLLGGPSKHHGWDADGMRAMLAEIAARTPHLEAADSRRTPEEFFESLDFIETRHPHRETPPGWLAARLATAREVWVTEDSVSMVYEALTGGAKVGVLPVPRLRDDARVVQGLDRLLAEGWATRFEDWKAGGALKSPPAPLAEADRAAKWVLDILTKNQTRE